MVELFKIVRWELFKIFSKWRTYIGFITILVLTPLIMLLIRKFGWEFELDAASSISDTFDYYGRAVNGLFISYYLMNVLWVHFPFFVILVAGDIMAAEGASGTYRMLLTRPVSRWQIVTGKYIATYLYTLAIVLFMGLVTIGIGMLVLGGGDLLVVGNGITIFSQSEALGRFLVAYLVASVVQMTVGGLAFVFSTWTSNAVGPIIGSYAVIVVSYILALIKIDALKVVQPYLFVNYFNVFFSPFAYPLPWRYIGVQLTKLLIFVVVFYLISLVSFVRKDIKT